MNGTAAGQEQVSAVWTTFQSDQQGAAFVLHSAILAGNSSPILHFIEPAGIIPESFLSPSLEEG
jgi:hypothetical protein